MALTVIVKTPFPCRDKVPRQGFRKIDGAPSLYRARQWPYKGRRTLIKRYSP